MIPADTKSANAGQFIQMFDLDKQQETLKSIRKYVAEDLNRASDIHFYAHIPFCVKKCSYCPYIKKAQPTDGNQITDYYVEALGKEVDFLLFQIPNQKVSAIFIGGGTPSYLKSQQLAQIFNKLLNNSALKPGLELTLEMHPHDVSTNYINDYISITNETTISQMVKRISIGVQTLDEDVFAFLNRSGSVQDSYNAIDEISLHNEIIMNVDLMFGLPNQTKDSFVMDLKFLIECKIPSISIEPTRILKGTALASLVRNNAVEIPIDDFEQLRSIAFYLLESAGYKQNSFRNHITWVLPGYNRKYMGNSTAPRIGIGAGACTETSRVRVANEVAVQKYINCINKSALNEFIPAINSGHIYTEDEQLINSMFADLNNYGFVILGFDLSPDVVVSKFPILGSDIFRLETDYRFGHILRLQNIKTTYELKTALFLSLKQSNSSHQG